MPAGFAGRAAVQNGGRVDSRAVVAPSLPQDEEEGVWSIATVAIAVVGGILAAVVIAGGASSWVAMFVISLVLGVVAMANPRACVFLTLPYLAVQGDVRRIVSLGMPAGSDPLVLVGPVIVLLLTTLALLQDRLTRSTPLARSVLLVLVIMMVQAFNPRQGGLIVGAMGVLCVMVPMCWFWVGQSWGSADFVDSVLYRAVVPVAIGAAALGIYQVFVGRLSYQEAWVRWLYEGRQASPDIARPFGTFTSVSEFTKYLSSAIVLLIASAFGGRVRLLLLGLPVLAVALFLAAANGPIVFCSGVVVLLWAMRSRTSAGWVWRCSAAGLVVVGGLVLTLNEVHEMEVAPELEYMVKRQTNGLLNPFDERKSTAVGHAEAVVSGLARGVRDPLGLGLGSITHVSSGYGGKTAGTEVDLSNMFVALGLAGGVVYGLIYFNVYRTGLRIWRAKRQPILLSIAAVLLFLTGNWINTGDYSTVALAWFCIGALDRQWAQTQHGLQPQTRAEASPFAGWAQVDAR